MQNCSVLEVGEARVGNAGGVFERRAREAEQDTLVYDVGGEEEETGDQPHDRQAWRQEERREDEVKQKAVAGAELEARRLCAPRH